LSWVRAPSATPSIDKKARYPSDSGLFLWESIKSDPVKSELQVIFGLLAVIALPVLAVVIWQVRRHQLARRAARDMKRGNQIYSEWRRKAQPPKAD
jgi:hypothetical protein